MWYVDEIQGKKALIPLPEGALDLYLSTLLLPIVASRNTSSETATITRRDRYTHESGPVYASTVGGGRLAHFDCSSPRAAQRVAPPHLRATSAVLIWGPASQDETFMVNHDFACLTTHCESRCPMRLRHAQIQFWQTRRARLASSLLVLAERFGNSN